MTEPMSPAEFEFLTMLGVQPEFDQVEPSFVGGQPSWHEPPSQVGRTIDLDEESSSTHVDHPEQYLQEWNTSGKAGVPPPGPIPTIHQPPLPTAGSSANTAEVAVPIPPPVHPTVEETDVHRDVTSDKAPREQDLGGGTKHNVPRAIAQGIRKRKRGVDDGEEDETETQVALPPPAHACGLIVEAPALPGPRTTADPPAAPAKRKQTEQTKRQPETRHAAAEPANVVAGPSRLDVGQAVVMQTTMARPVPSCSSAAADQPAAPVKPKRQRTRRQPYAASADTAPSNAVAGPSRLSGGQALNMQPPNRWSGTAHSSVVQQADPVSHERVIELARLQRAQFPFPPSIILPEPQALVSTPSPPIQLPILPAFNVAQQDVTWTLPLVPPGSTPQLSARTARIQAHRGVTRTPYPAPQQLPLTPELQNGGGLPVPQWARQMQPAPPRWMTGPASQYGAEPQGQYPPPPGYYPMTTERQNDPTYVPGQQDVQYPLPGQLPFVQEQQYDIATFRFPGQDGAQYPLIAHVPMQQYNAAPFQLPMVPQGRYDPAPASFPEHGGQPQFPAQGGAQYPPLVQVPERQYDTTPLQQPMVPQERYQPAPSEFPGPGGPYQFPPLP
ncbi:hypothetical protein Hypma_001396 [Hypsizygus marmoreus]|uniref:Uncharacterized protein n=1 Tax=Hypsizygus marmoreus TaxID=39966 RepID=A0A369K3J8_HYPMA|nr:hypothetical protein Hypma_001396 [Hypsizygus marmoreus]